MIVVLGLCVCDRTTVILHEKCPACIQVMACMLCQPLQEKLVRVIVSLHSSCGHGRSRVAVKSRVCPTACYFQDLVEVC